MPVAKPAIEYHHRKSHAIVIRPDRFHIPLQAIMPVQRAGGDFAMNTIDDLNRTGWDTITPLIQAKHEQMNEHRRISEAKASLALTKDQEDGSGTSAQDAIEAVREQAGSDENRAPGELSDEEQAQVDQLKSRDREVRAHEQAHANVGGQYAGAPTYTYQTGPDNQRYAVGGEVAIDVTPVKGDPEATIDKMSIVIAAALAPAEPSPQDRKVAALAQSQLAQAMAELMSQRAEDRNNGDYDKTL